MTIRLFLNLFLNFLITKNKATKISHNPSQKSFSNIFLHIPLHLLHHYTFCLPLSPTQYSLLQSSFHFIHSPHILLYTHTHILTHTTHMHIPLHSKYTHFTHILLFIHTRLPIKSFLHIPHTLIHILSLQLILHSQHLYFQNTHTTHNPYTHLLTHSYTLLHIPSSPSNLLQHISTIHPSSSLFQHMLLILTLHFKPK